MASLLSRGSCQQNQSGEVTKDPVVAPADVTLEGVDTSALTIREKREWSGYVSKLQAPCAGAGTVAECVQSKNACQSCLPAAQFLLKQVRDGRGDEQVEQAYKNRYDASAVKEVAIDESPSKGPENAAVTVVEFADFECPHCGLMAPVIKKAFTERKTQVRVVFKFMPLPSHPHGEISAKAGVAAFRQGKFWELQDLMFANQQRLAQSDLEKYARDLGLDIGKFRTDLGGTEAKDRIERDRKLADALEVQGTPTLYINGRLFDSRQDLGEWIDAELRGKGLDPKAVKAESAAAAEPAAPAVPSAAPSAAAPGKDGKDAKKAPAPAASK